MNKFNLLKVAVILVGIIAFSSCEEDFSPIGAEVISQSGDLLNVNRTVIAYSKELVPVQTNGLPLYQLGVYNDDVFGKSTANILSQVTLGTLEPTFGENPEVEKVVLYMPYFSTATTTADEVTYDLDSVYGTSPINIKIFESDFFLRDFDPNTNFEEAQKYFSDQQSTFESFLGEELLAIEDYVPSNTGFTLNEGTDEEEEIAPGIRFELPTEFFKEKIIDQEGNAVLLSNNNFIDYFRGIYFQVTGDVGETNLALFNLANANITITYSFDDEDEEDDRGEDDIQLLFNRISVNTFDNELPTEVQTAVDSPDNENGEETLYIKGGAGVVTVLELFGEDADDNGVADELEELRNNEWLINEANLVFYVDQDKVTAGASEPERVIVYDANNSTVLVDYSLDLTSSLTPINAITTHLGRLEREDDEDESSAGVSYKIRITNHIANLINNDSTNVPLGLIVSQNVLQGGFRDLQNPQAPGIEGVPASGIISPEGTVLYGNNTTNEDKKLKLEIFYTEPN